MRARQLFALVSIALLVAGCASKGGSAGSDDAKSQLSAALLETSARDAITMDVTIDSDVDSLTSMAEGGLTAEQAQQILDSSITLSGKQADDPVDATSLIKVNVAGSDSIEMRVVNDSLYLRADVKGLLQMFGQDTSSVDKFVKEAQAMGLDWAQKMIDGDWIVIKGLSQMSQGLGGGQTPQVDQQKIISDLANDVADNATVTDEGEEGGATHLVATLPLRETGQDILNDLGPAAQTLQGLGEMPDIPEGNLSVDFWVNGTTLERINLDLVQLGELSGTPAPDGIKQLALDVAISDFSGSVEPVDGAFEVDAGALGQALLGGLAGAGGDTGGGIDCNMLKNAPKEVIKLYEKECPDLQK
jgi:hypothetical protein